MKIHSMKIILNSNIFFIFINILTKYVVRETIEPVDIFTYKIDSKDTEKCDKE